MPYAPKGQSLAKRKGHSRDDKLRLGEQFIEARLQGKTLREIGDLHGCSGAWVSKMLDYAMAWRLEPGVEALRALEDARLDRIVNRFDAIIEAPMDVVVLDADGNRVVVPSPIRPEHRIQALNGVLRAVERRAAIHGLNKPAKIEAVIVHEAPEDEALRELIRAANARAEAEQARIAAEVAARSDVPVPVAGPGQRMVVPPSLTA